MQLDEFKRLVDSHLGNASGHPRSTSENEFLEEINGCFPAAQSSKSLAAVKRLLHDLAIRHLCDDDALQPYRHVAQALQLALRTDGTSPAEGTDWEAAVRAAVRHLRDFPPTLSDDRALVANVRAQVVSKSVRGLRDFGYQILLPPTGGLDISEPELSRLQADIEMLAKTLGGAALVSSALGAIERTYSTVTDRFRLGRNGQTVRLDAEPQAPLAFMFQLGLKFFHCPQSTDAGEPEFAKLVRLLTFAVGVLDLESDGAVGLLFARPADIFESTRKSLLFDANFCLTQANPKHVRVFVQWLLTHSPFDAFVDKNGFSAAHVLTAAEFLLHETNTGSISFHAVPHAPLAAMTGLSLEAAKRLLVGVFAHRHGKVNRKLMFPLQDTEVDSAFRPLLTDDKGGLIRLPRNLSARAVLNAVITWCRDTWPEKAGFDEKLGLVLEDFVRAQFGARGVKVHYGSYSDGDAKGECDLVIQTDSHIVFFELKGKVLTRQSRCGDVLKALQDLADSLARPQAQAMERHAFLKERGKMELKSGEEIAIIELGSRPVLKVSVTRGELLSLHDRPYVQHYLVTGCVSRFETTDPLQQSLLDPLHEWFSDFKDAAKRAGEYDISSAFPFSRCWSLSLFQILMLLERTATGDDFVRELLRTAKLITPGRDFYTTFEFKVGLDECLPEAGAGLRAG
jgi:hypothetical protein